MNTGGLLAHLPYLCFVYVEVEAILNILYKNKDSRQHFDKYLDHGDH